MICASLVTIDEMSDVSPDTSIPFNTVPASLKSTFPAASNCTGVPASVDATSAAAAAVTDPMFGANAARMLRPETSKDAGMTRRSAPISVRR